MIRKTKKISQLKYLLLVPALLSMLFYVSCSKENLDSKSEKITVEKKIKKIYFGNPDDLESGRQTGQESYLDIYMGNEVPNKKEFSYNDLSYNEQQEFDEIVRDFKEKDEDNLVDLSKLKIYEFEEGRKTVALIYDFKKWKASRKPAEQFEDGSYSVLQTNETPVFPGCPEKRTDCFFEKLEEHFQNNFNKSIPNNLGLNSGIEKVQVTFNIDVNGKVTDLEVTAPHPKIKVEVERVLYSLPTVTAGKIDGKAVKVKYTMPFKIKVD